MLTSNIKKKSFKIKKNKKIEHHLNSLLVEENSVQKF
jgi:hypothetical protein